MCFVANYTKTARRYLSRRILSVGGLANSQPSVQDILGISCSTLFGDILASCHYVYALAILVLSIGEAVVYFMTI